MNSSKYVALIELPKIYRMANSDVEILATEIMIFQSFWCPTCHLPSTRMMESGLWSGDVCTHTAGSQTRVLGAWCSQHLLCAGA